MSAPHSDDLALPFTQGVIHCSVPVADVKLVRDPIVQQCLVQMISQNSQQKAEISSLKIGQDKIMRMLSKLVSQRSSKSRPSGIVVRPGVSSTSGSGGGDACSSSSFGSSLAGSAGSELSQDEEGLVLSCQFCNAVHHNEKSHWQHLDRLGKRIGMFYSGDCVLTPDHRLLRSYVGTDVERMHSFIKDYNSHISSSKEKGINRVRAAKLSAFVASKSQ
jgi:hypothetical protein